MHELHLANTIHLDIGTISPDIRATSPDIKNMPTITKGGMIKTTVIQHIAT